MKQFPLKRKNPNVGKSEEVFEIVLYIVFGSVVSLVVILCLKISTVKFLNSEFLLGYLGIFLGFSFSIITFIISLLDKASTKIASDNSYTAIQKQESKRRITLLLDEINDNMKFLFFSFLFVIIIMIIEVWDVPNFVVSSDLFYSKVNLLNAVKFSIFGFSVYGIYDLLVTTFDLNNRVDNILHRTTP